MTSSSFIIKWISMHNNVHMNARKLWKPNVPELMLQHIEQTQLVNQAQHINQRHPVNHVPDVENVLILILP
ncbi:hypothetical protein CVT26_016067 [Gymnopilus dilepis]|uniref:Uncharacterized protein n=1 Tax=Gymnopilus dilepis TaxID=231916 RepID=A0A409YDQ9_9AGAR|nr:hypothetical protein CVT26_016067 [Gymnopilus dilepis]